MRTYKIMDLTVLLKSSIVFALCFEVHIILSTAAEDNVPTNSSSPCEDGWEHHGEFCIKMEKQPAYWRQASSNCISMGGNLASIHSKAQNDLYLELSKKAGIYYLWIGLSDHDSNNIFEWQDGTYFDYKYWEGPYCITTFDDFDDYSYDHFHDFDDYSHGHCYHYCRGFHLVVSRSIFGGYGDHGHPPFGRCNCRRILHCTPAFSSGHCVELSAIDSGKWSGKSCSIPTAYLCQKKLSTPVIASTEENNSTDYDIFPWSRPVMASTEEKNSAVTATTITSTEVNGKSAAATIISSTDVDNKTAGATIITRTEMDNSTSTATARTGVEDRTGTATAGTGVEGRTAEATIISSTEVDDETAGTTNTSADLNDKTATATTVSSTGVDDKTAATIITSTNLDVKTEKTTMITTTDVDEKTAKYTGGTQDDKYSVFSLKTFIIILSVIIIFMALVGGLYYKRSWLERKSLKMSTVLFRRLKSSNKSSTSFILNKNEKYDGSMDKYTTRYVSFKNDV